MPERAVQNTSMPGWILLALLGWTLLAAIPTSSAYIAEGSLGLGRWLYIFGHIAPYYYLWALFTPLIYRAAAGPIHPRKGLLLAIGGHLAIAWTLSLAFGFVVHLSNWKAWVIGEHAVGYYAMSGFSYGFILLCIYFYSLHRKVREQDRLIADEQRHRSTLEGSLARAQVDALRGQMNPHFLFNALNCIGALIETGRKDRAYQALEDLGAMLRTSLEHRDHEFVPLSEELEFVRRYIAMEQVRFGERLGVGIEVDSAAARWPVPPFILQPLIENAVKHAVAPSRDSVMVSIEARRSAGGIRLQVSDNGPGNHRTTDSTGTGVGLQNLRQRLRLLYGECAELEFSQDESGTCVSMTIPDHSGLYLAPRADYPAGTEDQGLADQSNQDSPVRRPRGAAV